MVLDKVEDQPGASTPATCRQGVALGRAQLLDRLLGGSSGPGLTGALDELARSLTDLNDPGGEVALRTLAEHAPILEALFLRLTAEAMSERNPERQHRKLRSALLAHSEYARTVVLCGGLARQKRGDASVILHDDDHVNVNAPA